MIEIAVYDTKPYDREYLEQAAGAERVTWCFHEFRLSVKTASAAKDAQGVCLFVNDQADRSSIEILSSLGVKLLALRCAGANNVDLVAARALGLSVVRVPAYSPHAVAEHAVALLLTLNRKIHRAYNRVRDLNFSLKGLVGFDLHGKTVGIVGTGKIGRIAAQIFRGFEMEVLAYDSFPAMDWATSHGVLYVDFDTLLARSDVISLHIPLLPETNQMLNQRTLAQMKPGVFIINTSRGKLIDSGALITALQAGHVGGVALDVYEEEEGIFFEDLSGKILHDDELSLLLSFPNVLITAHQAFLTREALREIAQVTTKNILQFEAGEAFLAGTTL
ncbi:MAG: hydroxyacid dehydrogenase [Candidatus Omnitrophica bacterium CG11_big_fil_rev_8_21_14_0_20_45_26]|uniref:Hydroxyacid dehydrogenase n=1 Tax=Candidatus Abzuiibacterium crystallinum TaxID=1974748 RepID=A0A2H0LP35_9BACT|nr:MAG: hydroxyacid dehydrogenase [Candidatus Omnitrophica bacterium CG11_big_fil_rev_8_21_14_0_20_45_26]